MIRSVYAAAALVAAVGLVAGCSDDDSSTATSTTTATSSVTGDVTVFAAASLNKSFTEIGKQFETEYPGTTVKFNFAGSSDLATQIIQGAPADVFASANPANMTKVVDAGEVQGEPENFASNTLTIVTAPGNPKGITSFADLTKPGVSVVVCADQVPCGAATKTVEEKTGVTLTPVSEESQVTDVLGKVTSGQADAGLVYVTDAKGAGDKVTQVDFPEAAEAVNVYPIAVLSDSQNSEAAKEFLEAVTGPEGQKVLAEAGFAGP
ncbi:molybdate ABC transporter substrate-binding protein [Aldersonia sp. NBC_00410]|uniref:molybdate ABC transporter substrate-binding protein n=1 Tax=Aldersonia sp. NBC_00410 TaxID=2975954 RepID=UPI0022528E7C|nr:molybdate ABC transporter substrate-binding protein [Aldersonia sp. NBC_00410]MCX5046512.1 molybdate ABC transporter substrate-binding protein [Aldersonia sp. NBC_00410]